MPEFQSSSETVARTGRTGIRRRALLMIGATLLAFGALSILLNQYRSSNTAYADLDTRADIIAALQARSAAIPLFDFDFEQVGEIVKASAGDPDNLASIVRDPSGKVVASDGNLTAATGFIEVVREIKGGAAGQYARIGEYVLRLATARIDAQLWNDPAFQCISGAVTFAVIMAVLYVI